VRYPQKELIKVIRKILPAEEARELITVAYEMCLDIYKTFAPIKASTFTIVLAIIELAALVTDKQLERVQSIDPYKYSTTRGCVTETMLDLLDLYTLFQKSTKVGTQFELAKFIDIKIKLNQEVDSDKRLARFQEWCSKCEADDKEKYPITPGSATSPATTGSFPGSNSVKLGTKATENLTMRFVFDSEEARKEQERVAEYYKEEYEQYEIEVEEPIPEHENRGHQGRDRGYHGHRNHHDSGWGPYGRNRHDRHRGRKGGYH